MPSSLQTQEKAPCLGGSKQIIPMPSSQHCQRFPGFIPSHSWSVQGQCSNNKRQWLFTVPPAAQYQYQHALYCQETSAPSTLAYSQPSAAACLHSFSHSYSSHSQHCSTCPVIFPTHHVNKVTSDLRDESHMPMGGDKWGGDRINVTALYPFPSSFRNRITQKSPDASTAKW